MTFAPVHTRFAVQSACLSSQVQITKPCLAAACKPRPMRRRTVVYSNEISRWGNTDGRDEDAGMEDDGFEKDTARTMLKILTARATQKLLMQLQELDLHVANWLADFCSRNAPTGGDKFLLALLHEAGTDLVDTPNKVSHIVSPADLADRILATRTDMAQRIGSNFPQFVQQAYLMCSSFLSCIVSENQIEKEGVDLKVRYLSKSYNKSASRR